MIGSRRKFVISSGLAAASIAVRAGIASAADTPPAVAASSAAAPGPDHAIDVVSLNDVEQTAKAVLSPGAYAFVAGGAGDEWTLRENRRAFDDYPILTHRLRGVDDKTIALGTQLLGHDMPSPLLVMPLGVHGFVHPAAKAATADHPYGECRS